MDRLYEIRRYHRDMNSYSTGSCHVCKQCNVRVRRLTCGKHNYCRMCVEFVPRLIKGDFSCKTCSGRRVFDVARRQDDVDVDILLTSTTGSCHTDNTFTVGENKLVAFDEPNDDTDLDGNNTEWDYLLQSIDEKSTDKKMEERISWENDSVNLGTPTHVETSGMIPRKRSYVQLAPSATLFGLKHPSTAENQSHRKSNTIMIVDPSKDRFRNSLKPCHVNKLVSRVLFRPDPMELERGTSPCKSHRRKDSLTSPDGDIGDLQDYIDPCVSETEQLREQIGDIEGPAFNSSSTSGSGSEESLVLSSPNRSPNNEEFEEFWDRK